MTQAVSRWAYDHGDGGLVYTSRFGMDLECAGIFEGVNVQSLSVNEIARDDPDLIWAMALLNLTAQSYQT